jgi:hypothetical protein
MLLVAFDLVNWRMNMSMGCNDLGVAGMARIVLGSDQEKLFNRRQVLVTGK